MRALCSSLAVFGLLAAGCGDGTVGELGGQDDLGSGSSALAPSCSATPPDASKSLFVTDPTALASFSFQAVMDQIVATGSTTGQTSLGVYQQLVDTLNTKAAGVTSGPHCDDVLTGGVPSINGFPIQCPRQEGTLAKTNPFVAGNDALIPIGLVNRFDLAPSNGANCGQYRVVYGKQSGLTNGLNRFLLIFEAVLPNPTPSAGIAGCLPVAQFWDNLTNDNDVNDRAKQLKNFYFFGLAGPQGQVFPAVIRAQNYGIGGGTNTGQIRANMFMASVSGQEWELREFRLAQQCKNPTTCNLIARNTFVRVNPFGGLFGGTDAASVAFQTNFLTHVKGLTAKTVPGIAFTNPVADNAGESDEQDQSNDYAFQGRNNTAFLSQITAKLAQLKRTDLTATNVLDRATTQSCAGCHELSNNKNLGASLTWPSSNGFTQIDERSTLSPALKNFFLPARATVLVNFINSQCADGGQALVDDGLTLGGSELDAAN